MYQSVADCMSRQMLVGYEPIIKMNALMLAMMEEMVELELSAMKTYADLGFDLARSMVCANNPNDMAQCGEQFMRTLGELGKQVVEHAQAHHQIGMSFQEKMDEVL